MYNIQWNMVIKRNKITVIKRKKIMSFAATWMRLKIVILSEVSREENNKFGVSSHVCGI